MEYVEIVLKLIIGISILNVWLVRSKKSTEWRGGDASNIREEFKNYGLPEWFMYLIGTLKVTLAFFLLLSIGFSTLWGIEIGTYAAYGIAILMLGAVSMHVKIGDELKKSFPAFTFLVLSLIVGYF
jgi:hypothetical protein